VIPGGSIEPIIAWRSAGIGGAGASQLTPVCLGAVGVNLTLAFGTRFPVEYRLMRRRFFVERFEGRRAVLRGDAAHHAGRVLRIQPGQLYELSDGTAVWLALVEAVGRDAVQFSLVEPVPVTAAKLHTALLLSIVKFDRFEWALEKATELGVMEIVPLAAARSEKALVAAATKRARRWEKILAEAAQQSRRLRQPMLHPVARPASAFRSTYLSAVSACSAEDVPSILLFFSESKDASSLRTAINNLKPVSRVILAIGPEGGWTADEREAALAANFAEVSLGANILRTETAVAAALAAVNYALGE
jgi:16S rRNA (uracil1498-N3)-methyltransferase